MKCLTCHGAKTYTTEAEKMANHWLKPSADTIVSLLDRNLTTLKYARTYFRAYGLDVKGRTKRDFIRNLHTLLNSETRNEG